MDSYIQLFDACRACYSFDNIHDKIVKIYLQ